MRHPSLAVRFDWDDRNIDKLAKREIRPDEVEAVWAGAPRYFRNKHAGTVTWLMEGRDYRSGRRLRAGILWVDEADGVLRAIHALELRRDRAK